MYPMSRKFTGTVETDIRQSTQYWGRPTG